jgi:hypothetical protein
VASPTASVTDRDVAERAHLGSARAPTSPLSSGHPVIFMDEHSAQGAPATHRTYDLVVVANRLPVDRTTADDGTVRWAASPGGLVTAMLVGRRR